MKAFSRLISKYIKKNFFRVILTIIGLVISISAIVFLLTSLVSIHKTVLVSTIDDTGFQDFSAEGINDEVFNKLLTTKNVSKLARICRNKRALNYYPNLNGNEAITSLEMKDVDPDYFSFFFKNKLIEGRLPINDGEALLPYDLKDSIPEFSKLGFRISVDTVDSKDYFEFAKGFKFFEGDYSKKSLDTLLRIRKEGFSNYIKKEYGKNEKRYLSDEFTIVGYYSSHSLSFGVNNRESFNKYDYGEFHFFEGTILRYNSKIENDYDVVGLYSKFDDIEDSKNVVEGIVDSFDKDIRLVHNNILLTLKYPSFSNSFIYYLSTIILLALLMFSITVFIYNIFSANFSDKKRDFGMLRVVGLTNRQMIKIIFLEALIYFVISLPIGYLLGQLLTKQAFLYMGKIFSDSIVGIYFDFLYENNSLVFIITAVISLLQILFSQLMASWEVLKTSPIKAANNVFSNEAYNKPKGYQLLIKKLFGYDAYLSIRSATKDYRKFALTTMSITLSLVIVVLSTFITKTFDIQISKTLKKENNSFGIFTSDNWKNTQAFKKDMERIAGIEAKFLVSYAEVTLSDEKGELNNKSNMLITIDDSYFNKLFPHLKSEEKLALTMKKVSDKSISYNNISVLPKGEKSELELMGKLNHEKIRRTNFQLELISEKIPEIMMYMKNYENYDNVLLTKKSNFNNLNPLNYNFVDVIELFKNSSSPSIDEEVKSVLTKYPRVFIDSYNSPFVDTLKLYTWGIVTAIIMIAILNVFNTIYSNIMSRRREMALVRAVGIEEKRLRRIILNQPIISVYIASFLSFIFSSVVIYLIYSIQKGEMGGNLVPLYYPISVYLAGVIITLMLVYITAITQYRAIDKYNLSNELKAM